MPSTTKPTWGVHTDFNGFVVKSSMMEMPMYLPVVRIDNDDPIECDTCVEHMAVYEVRDLDEACSTVLCQSCAVDCANAFELGNPDEWLSKVLFRVIVSPTEHFYVASGEAVRFHSAKRAGYTHGDLPMVAIDYDTWKGLQS